MAKATKGKSPPKKGDLSPQQQARIRELGRPGKGWRPWRLALRYGVSEAKIIEIIGKSADGRTGGKWVADKKPKVKPAAKKASAPKVGKKQVTRPKSPARTTEKKSQHPAEKKPVEAPAAPAAPATGGSRLDQVFGKKPEASSDIPLNPAQVA